MTPDVKKYPLDLTGEAITNRVKDEEKTVNSPYNRLINLSAGIFYSKGLIINYVEGERVLEIGKDFILNYIHEDVTIRSGVPAYALIVIINKEIIGKLLISYQVVGGEYTKLDDAVLEALKHINESDMIVTWEGVINKPLTYPPTAHFHTGDDIVGTDDIVNSINSIADAIQGQHPDKIEQIYEVLDTKVSNLSYMRLNQVDIQWLLTTQTPLRISVRPFPSAIVVSLDIWQEDQGYSNVEVSGELSADGAWKNRNYIVTKGNVPSIELQLMITDGSSAEILIRATKSVTLNVTPNKVIYLKHRPEVSSVSCIDMDTIGVAIPNEFLVPIKD